MTSYFCSKGQFGNPLVEHPVTLPSTLVHPAKPLLLTPLLRAVPAFLRCTDFYCLFQGPYYQVFSLSICKCPSFHVNVCFWSPELPSYVLQDVSCLLCL